MATVASVRDLLLRDNDDDGDIGGMDGDDVPFEGGSERKRVFRPTTRVDPFEREIFVDHIARLQRELTVTRQSGGGDPAVFTKLEAEVAQLRQNVAQLRDRLIALEYNQGHNARARRGGILDSLRELGEASVEQLAQHGKTSPGSIHNALSRFRDLIESRRDVGLRRMVYRLKRDGSAAT